VFPSSCHPALMLMNDFKPLIIEDTAPVAAQGTALAQKQRKEVEHWLPAPSAPIIRNTLLTRNATPVVRRGTHQDVALGRKARLRRIRRTTSWSLATSLPRQSSP
jgi:hypothetical protein